MHLLVCGVPGVGKTTFVGHLCKSLPDYTVVNISEYVIANKLYTEYDEEFQSHVPDDNKLIDSLEHLMQTNPNIIIDHHTTYIFPVRWFDAVVLLHASTEVLFDRLQARNYSSRKVRENIEAEIMHIVDEELYSDFPPAIIHEFRNDTIEHQEAAIAFVTRLITEHSALGGKRACTENVVFDALLRFRK